MEKKIRKLISEFLVHLGIDFTEVQVEQLDETNYRVNVISEEPSLLIGHHGDNRHAMQKIIKVMVHQQFGDEINVMFDIDDYCKRQEENVLSIAQQKIKEVQDTGIKSALPPMSPYFRRIVHMFVRDNGYDDIATESIGEGNYRQVVIKPKA